MIETLIKLSIFFSEFLKNKKTTEKNEDLENVPKLTEALPVGVIAMLLRVTLQVIARLQACHMLAHWHWCAIFVSLPISVRIRGVDLHALCSVVHGVGEKVETKLYVCVLVSFLFVDDLLRTPIKAVTFH